LSDAWELKYFNTLGQNPFVDPDGDGLKLMLENAFNLSPTVPDATSPRLPRAVIPGAKSPAALGALQRPRIAAVVRRFRFAGPAGAKPQRLPRLAGVFDC
jgi:hypothetical protein